MVYLNIQTSGLHAFRGSLGLPLDKRLTKEPFDLSNNGRQVNPSEIGALRNTVDTVGIVKDPLAIQP